MHVLILYCNDIFYTPPGWGVADIEPGKMVAWIASLLDRLLHHTLRADLPLLVQAEGITSSRYD